MKYMFILYAIIAMAVQIGLGRLTGQGQGSIGFLTFLFLLEVDPRFKFRYVLPNVKERHNEHHKKGDQS